MTFKSGESGNPNGRPIGSTNKRTQLAKLLEPYAEELVTKAVELARTGDVNALRLCLERLIPKATQEPIKLDFSLSDVSKLEYLSEIGKKLILAVSNGEITPNEAQTISTLLDNHRKLIEHGELKRKLDEIEEAVKWNK